MMDNNSASYKSIEEDRTISLASGIHEDVALLASNADVSSLYPAALDFFVAFSLVFLLCAQACKTFGVSRVPLAAGKIRLFVFDQVGLVQTQVLGCLSRIELDKTGSRRKEQSVKD